MDEEETRPTAAARTGFEPRVLDRMGVGELESYIAVLQAEIARAELHIASKRDGRSAADALFRFTPMEKGPG